MFPIQLISVIVPVYNTAPWLVRCVDSILAQTYTNLEIILVNDGSTDGCGQVCDDYALHDNRIKVIHKTYGGPASARNAGLDIARGDWIAFVDSDDWILPEMYERLLEVANNKKAEMVICGFYYVNEQGEVLKKSEFNANTTFSKTEAFYNLLKNLPVLYVVVWNKLYKKCIFDHVRFPQGKIHEDEAIAHEIIDKCSSIETLTEKMYMYVQRNNSIMGRQYSVKRLQDSWDAAFGRYVFFNKHGYRKYARYTKRDLGYTLRTGMKNLSRNEHKNLILPLYQKALWLLICALDIRAIKLFFAWHTWRFRSFEKR